MTEVRSQVSLNDLLNGVAQLDTSELEQFISQVLTLRAKRIAPSFSKQEAEILEKINQGLPPETQQRYNEMIAKRRAETLTSEEHLELSALIDRIELADVERVKALTNLAQLRNVSVTALMTTLNIRPSAYG
ncbi:MAG: STAS/SEC14 domain-containing protein [Gammaproteobacteria bacterium]|nr:STAS/SEC14 domain-containing protein [Gammaproteobacteria bacterium]